MEQDNCVLHRSENHLILKKLGRIIGTIPLANVNCIVTRSSVQITSSAMDLLFEKHIDVVYTSRGGKIHGRLMSMSGGGALVRLAQHNAFLKSEIRSKIAANMVRGKIYNEVCLLQKYKRYYTLKQYDEVITKMKSYAILATQTDNIDEIMGYEGVSAKLYWECFRDLIKSKVFFRREYRPAPDYVNSALNLGYSFLANEMITCLAAEKFDLEIGFLHSIHYGRVSLALDLMEEFRTPFVDAWLLKQFNRRILNETHFTGAEHGFYLTEDGFRRFISLYHQHKNEENWQRRFREQAHLLKKVVMYGADYIPYPWQ